MIHKGVNKYIGAEPIFLWVSGINYLEVFFFIRTPANISSQFDLLNYLSPARS